MTYLQHKGTASLPAPLAWRSSFFLFFLLSFVSVIVSTMLLIFQWMKISKGSCEFKCKSLVMVVVQIQTASTSITKEVLLWYFWTCDGCHLINGCQQVSQLSFFTFSIVSGYILHASVIIYVLVVSPYYIALLWTWPQTQGRKTWGRKPSWGMCLAPGLQYICQAQHLFYTDWVFRQSGLNI